MDFVNPQISTVIFGFDSAWLDKNHGAICAIPFGDRGQVGFHAPQSVNFAKALDFIKKHRRGFDVSLIALDQPTVVPNAEGMRPVEKVAGALLGFIGGGVLPAFRNGKGEDMFGDDAPIWSFLHKVGAMQDPVRARTARTGHFLVEVFPALALPAFENDFAQQHGAPKYGPAKPKKFRLDDWRAVARAVAATAERFNINCLAKWVHEEMHCLDQPKKPNQDMLDAALCALIGLAWRAGSVTCSAMLGDLSTGYMVTPISAAIRPTLEQAAIKRKVPFQIWCPGHQTGMDSAKETPQDRPAADRSYEPEIEDVRDEIGLVRAEIVDLRNQIQANTAALARIEAVLNARPPQGK